MTMLSKHIVRSFLSLVILFAVNFSSRAAGGGYTYTITITKNFALADGNRACRGGSVSPKVSVAVSDETVSQGSTHWRRSTSRVRLTARCEAAGVGVNDPKPSKRASSC